MVPMYGSTGSVSEVFAKWYLGHFAKRPILMLAVWYDSIHHTLVCCWKTLAARGLDERRNFKELLTESVGRVHFS
jgi:hypothetical protein